MSTNSGQIIDQISINTKAGQLKVGTDCNDDISLRTPRTFGNSSPQVNVILDKNHRSEDIQAKVSLRLSSDQARRLAKDLEVAANKADRRHE